MLSDELLLLERQSQNEIKEMLRKESQARHASLVAATLASESVMGGLAPPRHSSGLVPAVGGAPAGNRSTTVLSDEPQRVGSIQDAGDEETLEFLNGIVDIKTVDELWRAWSASVLEAPGKVKKPLSHTWQSMETARNGSTPKIYADWKKTTTGRDIVYNRKDLCVELAKRMPARDNPRTEQSIVDAFQKEVDTLNGTVPAGSGTLHKYNKILRSRRIAREKEERQAAKDSRPT